MSSTGVVTAWDSNEGWGVIESVDTPSGCWVHFSNIWAWPDLPLGRGESFEVSGQGVDLHVGQAVDFDWEPVEQDGYSCRALDVRPHGQRPPRRTVKFMVNGERAPWPVDRFGEIPYPDLWTE